MIHVFELTYVTLAFVLASFLEPPLEEVAVDEAGCHLGVPLALAVGRGVRVGGEGDWALSSSVFHLDFALGLRLGSDSDENWFEVGVSSCRFVLHRWLYESSGCRRFWFLDSVDFLEDSESSVSGLDCPILTEADGADVLPVGLQDVVDDGLLPLDLHFQVEIFFFAELKSRRGYRLGPAFV